MFHQIVKKVIVDILRAEAGAVLRKYRPKIIGITGSVGKTGTKDAVYQVLSKVARVRKSEKSYNSEIGLPLTVLGAANAWSSPIGWLKNILEGLSLIIFSADYPEWLVLEIGVDRPGNMRRVTEWVNFDLVVITRLPEVPVHVEFFTSPAQLATEKLLLAKAVRESGLVILNHDDPQIMAAVEKLKAQVFTYGFDSGANLRGSNERLIYENHLPVGLTLKLDYDGNTVPLRVRGMIGHHQLYGVLAAVAVGLSQGMNFVAVTEALEELATPPGRLRLLPGLKETLILDDTYNSSPAALDEALGTLERLETKGRKIAVLGDMLELGEHTLEAHRSAGLQAAKICDLLITIGLRAKFIHEEAERQKMGKKKLLHFTDAREAGRAVADLLKPGDIVLVKGSQADRLERVVEQIMLNPEDKENLLVRQEPEWLARE
ncbi:MAG: UDP-N-acetylmuramoyl-tripeptide--D-alanyl-D-alanine ligase [Candidatus Vogelbacteria bacterium]|nr:UDP-N-acetylmuramoyl-tripeptide--D-alanyl-D-alanine ligase [Candidatus Vogelbacteria bacterium]